jgi:branched-chain amino acid transport system permease protein
MTTSPQRFGTSARVLWPWVFFAVLLALAPMFARSAFSLSLLSQMGIAIVACLSYNILLGQGGMLSFGHAVYTGLASFMAVHALNRVADGSLPVPTSLVPLLAGLSGAAFAVVLGFVTTRKAGTPFAMITLGIGELVFAMSLMVPEFFGGEGGVSANRAAGPARLGITFGPPVEVYVLIAVYTFVCTAAMYAFTRTPLGRILNAVRDNPERVEFIGYSTRQVRFLAFVIAGFFAGIAGGMYAINFEIATAEVVGAARSGAYLLFTFLGGAVFFFGPILGGVLMVLATVLLSEFTKAWLLYLGLIFLFMVIYAPGGIASLIMMNVRVAAFGRLRPLLPLYAAMALAGMVVLTGTAALIEMIYHLQLQDTLGSTVPFAGLELDAHAVSSWAASVALMLGGAAVLEPLRRRFAQRWSQAQEAIEAEIRARESAA